MGVLYLLIVLFSPLVSPATLSCYGVFSRFEIVQKADAEYNKYFSQRTSSEDPQPSKLVELSHRIKKSEHPYSLFKKGLLQWVYLYLHSSGEKQSFDYYHRVDDFLAEYQSLSKNIYQELINYELKREHLKLIKIAIQQSNHTNVLLPKVNSNLIIEIENKRYPDLETLKLHFDQLVVEVSHLNKDQVYKNIESIEKAQAEIYLSLLEIKKIINKHIYVYDSSGQTIKKAEELNTVIQPILLNSNLHPTTKALSKVFQKMFFDNMGFVFRGHKYNQDIQDLNHQLKKTLPEEFNAQFGNKTMYDSFRIESRMNILKRVTGKVIDRSYFKNMFRFKFMGWSVLAVSLWITNPIQFIQNYDFGHALARLELQMNDSRYVYKMRTLEDEKFLDVASNIYMIMSKDYFKEVDGQIQFIKDPHSSVSPVETILKSLEARSNYQKEQGVSYEKKQIALYHTLQTVKLDALTNLAFSGKNTEFVDNLNQFLKNEHSAELALSQQVMLTQWLNAERSKPNVQFNIKAVSKSEIINSLEETFKFNFDSPTVEKLYEAINSYDSQKQVELISQSIWRDLETVHLIRSNYLKSYQSSKDPKAFRYQLIEDLAYELTATEFHFDSN